MGDTGGFEIGSNAFGSTLSTSTVTKDFSARSGLIIRTVNSSTAGRGSTLQIKTAVQGSTTLTNLLSISDQISKIVGFNL
jgi:hypothetical protein